jgi:hypothetical protein
MIAHLQDGSYEGTQILRPETAKLMHSRQFENMPGINGMCLGFYEETRNGHRIIGHGGDTEYFHSDLHLVLDQNLGFFISYNSAGKGEISAREAVWHKFLDRYFPYTPPAPQTGNAEDTSAYAGHYIVSRKSETNILKVLSVAGETKVNVNDDKTISVDALKDLNGEPKKFRQIGPSLYRDVNDQDLVGFKRNSSGDPVLVIDFPFMVFQKAPWYENSALNLPVIIGSLIVFLLALLLWPVGGLIRRHYHQQLPLEPGQRRMRMLVRLVCIAYLVFFAAFATFFSLAFKDIGLLSPHFNPYLRLIQLVGWLAVLGTVIALINAVRVWKSPDRWIWSRISETVIAVACLGGVWFIFVWNLLHWNLKY